MRRGVTLGATLVVLLAALLLGAAACSPLRTFDALVPKDGVGEVRRDIAYGEDARLRLDIYSPPGGAAAAPVLVFVHGGSWATGDKAGYSWAGRALASRGYLTVVPNYRLVPEGRYPAMVEDTAAAIRWAHANARDHGGDPSRLAVSGHSAGAYNALMAAYAPEFGASDLVRAVVSLSGPADFLPLDTDASRDAFGHLEGEALARTQPANRVRPGLPPTLIVHGTDDETVRPRNASILAQRLRDAGVPHELLLFEGVDHRGVVLGLSRPFRGRVATLDAMDRFLKATLGE